MNLKNSLNECKNVVGIGGAWHYLSNIDEIKSTVENWIIENNKEKIKQLVFKVELNDTNQFIGLIGIKLCKEHYKNAEVWFQYDFRFWNKGFGTEYLRKVLDFGFENLKLHRI